MIGKTTAAESAVTHSIRKAISRKPEGQGFAATLQQQRQRVDAARVASADSLPGADPGSAAPRGLGAPAAATSTARTPVGNRGEPGPSTRSPVSPGRAGEATPTASAEGPRPNLSTADVVVNTTGSLSEGADTEGMYVPPDFYHGNSYSPVFDQKDANGNAVRTPRFEGQVVYSDWRGSLPEDFDPNARVLRDPLAFENTPAFWKKDADGSWSKRDTGYGGTPLYDDGKPVYTPDPTLYPEYFKA